MKKIPAFIAALFITGVVGLVMLGIGISAFTNTNKASIKNSTMATSTASNVAVLPQITPSPASSSTDPAISNQAELDAYVSQLNQAIQNINNANSQIQTLQSQLDQANQQLSNANSTVQVYQSILLQLQQRGLITIGSDGTITIRGRS